MLGDLVGRSRTLGVDTAFFLGGAFVLVAGFGFIKAVTGQSRRAADDCESTPAGTPAGR